MKVSIIIPCYNAEKYIEECIVSCLEQDYKDIEIICVDNNSSDGTLALLHNYASKYSIRVFTEKKKGASAARNKGLAESTGEIIQFLDCDDLLLKEKISGQVAHIQKGVDLVIGAYQYNYFSGKKKAVHPLKDIWKGLFSTQLGITSANLWRRSILKKVKGWNEKLESSQEYNLMFQCLKSNASLSFDDKVTTIIRQQESGNISQTNIEGGTIRYLKLRVDICNYLKKSQPDYFLEEAEYYNQRLFDVIRRLYPLNKKESLKYYSFLFDSKFKPEVSISNSINYVRLFNLLGFKNTEKLKSLFSGKL